MARLTPWERRHRRWMDGKITTDALLAYAFAHKDEPAALVWAMTVIGLRAQKPSDFVKVISGV